MFAKFVGFGIAAVVLTGTAEAQRPCTPKERVRDRVEDVRDRREDRRDRADRRSLTTSDDDSTYHPDPLRGRADCPPFLRFGIRP